MSTWNVARDSERQNLPSVVSYSTTAVLSCVRHVHTASLGRLGEFIARKTYQQSSITGASNTSTASCCVPKEARTQQMCRPSSHSTGEGAAVGEQVLLEAGPQEGVREPGRALTPNRGSQRGASSLFTVRAELVRVQTPLLPVLSTPVGSIR